MKSLYQNIPTIVSMHVETIDHVCRESKRLPPILKVKQCTGVYQMKSLVYLVYICICQWM